MSEWLLMKRGLYYRPEDCGYTGIRDHAGRYTEEEARDRCGHGVARIRLDQAPEFSEACFDDLARAHLTKQRDEALAEVDRLRAAFIAGAAGGTNVSEDFDLDFDAAFWVECWECGGLGALPGCFEDCCSGADCDPEDAELCCSPSRCDTCKGKGGWHREDAALPAGQSGAPTEKQS